MSANRWERRDTQSHLDSIPCLRSRSLLRDTGRFRPQSNGLQEEVLVVVSVLASVQVLAREVLALEALEVLARNLVREVQGRK